MIQIQKKEGILKPADKDTKEKKTKSKSEAPFADGDAGAEDDFGQW